jgi:hypothetical protein
VRRCIIGRRQEPRGMKTHMGEVHAFPFISLQIESNEVGGGGCVGEIEPASWASFHSFPFTPSSSFEIRIFILHRNATESLKEIFAPISKNPHICCKYWGMIGPWRFFVPERSEYPRIDRSPLSSNPSLYLRPHSRTIRPVSNCSICLRLFQT